MSFKVLGYSIEKPEVVERDRIVEYQKPFLAIQLQITNNGNQPFVYSPTHSSKELTEVSTPLLYPKPENKDPPYGDEVTPIPGVFIEEGTIASQQNSPKTLKSGESIRDIYLFERPDFDDGRLVFSIPPSLHRGTLPVFFEIPYQYKKPKSPTIYGMNKWVSAGAFELRVTEAKVEFAELKDKVKGKSYSKKPLVKVSYEIKNPSEKPRQYDPIFRRALNMPGPILLDRENKTEYARAKFPATSRAVGQVVEKIKIGPGSRRSDISLFKIPETTSGTKDFVFAYPTTHLNGGKLLRFKTSIEITPPSPPKSIRDRLKSKSNK